MVLCRLTELVAPVQTSRWTKSIHREDALHKSIGDLTTPRQPLVAKRPPFGEPSRLLASIRGNRAPALRFEGLGRDGKSCPCPPVPEHDWRHLAVMNADGTSLRLLAETLDVRSSPSWSPDGKQVAVAASDSEGTRTNIVPVDTGKTFLRVRLGSVEQSR